MEWFLGMVHSDNFDWEKHFEELFSQSEAGFYILDAQGEPVQELDCKKWRNWNADINNRRLALYEKENIQVSAVFIGQGPCYWETCVFGGPDSGEIKRYYQRSSALRGHDDFVRRYLTS